MDGLNEGILYLQGSSNCSHICIDHNHWHCGLPSHPLIRTCLVSLPPYSHTNRTLNVANMPSEQSFVNHAKEQAQFALSQLDEEFGEKFKVHGGSKKDYFNSAVALTEGDLKTIRDGNYEKNTHLRANLLDDLNGRLPAQYTEATLEMRKRHEDIAHRVVVYGVSLTRSGRRSRLQRALATRADYF
jgi:hypothetical protein